MDEAERRTDRRMSPQRRGRKWTPRMQPVLGFILGASTGLAGGQSGVTHPVGPNPQSDPLSIPARQWAVDASGNELKVINYGNSFLRYRSHTRDSHGDQVRDLIESKNGTVARLILKDGRPLTAEEDADEHARLQAMLDSPAAFAKHVRGDVSGKKLGADMVRALPDAMLYSYADGQPQRASKSADDPPEVVIDFKPNPAWMPPGMEAQALTGLEGRAWIDARTHFLTRMEGNIFRGVNFGWGIFAHIYPGGKLTFEQTRVSEQRWLLTRFEEHVDVRVVVKTIRQNTNIETSQFASVPAMSYRDAIHVLLDTPLPR